MTKTTKSVYLYGQNTTTVSAEESFNKCSTCNKLGLCRLGNTRNEKTPESQSIY